MNEATPLLVGKGSAEVAVAQGEGPWTVKRLRLLVWLSVVSAVLCIALMVGLSDGVRRSVRQHSLGAAWSSRAAPLSTVDPADLGIMYVDRPPISKPGKAFETLVNLSIPLPTNSWYEDFMIGDDNTAPESSVFQVPYIVDTSGHLVGVRTHPCHVQANSRAVMMTYEPANGISLGTVEPLNRQHKVHSQGDPAISKLAIELEWTTTDGALAMRAPIVRGSPYMSMIYFNATPHVFVERHLKGTITVDQGAGAELVCGDGKRGLWSAPTSVQRELKLHLDTSDMTWLIFFSEPVQVECSNYDSTQDLQDLNLPPGMVVNIPSFFSLRATQPMARGMVRLAMSNNCTTGQNPQYCGVGGPAHDQSAYEDLLRSHSEAYPTASADVEFTFPVQSAEEEELRLTFHWRPNHMSNLAQHSDAYAANPHSTNALPAVEVLMFALPHHQERMRRTLLSSNAVQTAGCMPTIHGVACPAVGDAWSLVEHLHRTSFHAFDPPRAEMVGALREAALQDMEQFRIPPNYQRGAGDTYFSGKLLGRLARILIVADEMGLGTTPTFSRALAHLRSGVEVWLNGSAESPFLYDNSWRGLVMCGCDYHWFPEEHVGRCTNAFPDCPALADMGANYGAGFYNDHHYHYGYHIYAAAVVSKFDHRWGRRWHQHVLLLVRDIANPSNDDPFFPTWRHKDWYLGFSWASGIVTHLNRPYPNGRNQESVSEAIAAYEAVALYGDVMSGIFEGSQKETDRVLLDSALRCRDMGRLLVATETRSAHTYWHVQAPGTEGVARIYPDVYEPKVVGMIWSMLAQHQTWFGNEPWKCYGIQLLPLTVAAGARDDVSWVTEMLPAYSASCNADPVCLREGWTIPIYTSMATVGQWREAWQAVDALPADVFDSAGGNGHSLTNTLWYIATRPDPAAAR